MSHTAAPHSETLDAGAVPLSELASGTFEYLHNRQKKIGMLPEEQTVWRRKSTKFLKNFDLSTLIWMSWYW